jgi:hypothetical protein
MVRTVIKEQYIRQFVLCSEQEVVWKGKGKADKGNGHNTQKTERNCRGMESYLLINNTEWYMLIT